LRVSSRGGQDADVKRPPKARTVPKPKPKPSPKQAARPPAAPEAPARRRRAAGPKADPILAGRDLVKEYNTNGSSIRALDGVSIDVLPGSFVSVMGPSGSGKSTLMHILGGLDAPTSGDVLLEGKKLSGLDDKDVTLARRGSIGFVFQFFNLVPVLTVEENIALPLVIAGEAPESYAERLDAVIAQVGLADCRSQLPSQISGGQQQRTAIARAIFPEPAVLLGDEPTGNLDTRTSTQILELLKGLQKTHGQTIVIVTHDPRAAAYGDEVVYLEDGQITSTIDLNGSKGGDARATAVLSWLQKLGA
jgi:putative ABC transport system ATP-binding protein